MEGHCIQSKILLFLKVKKYVGVIVSGKDVDEFFFFNLSMEIQNVLEVYPLKRTACFIKHIVDFFFSKLGGKMFGISQSDIVSS